MNILGMFLYKDNCAGVDDSIYNVVHQQCEKLLTYIGKIVMRSRSVLRSSSYNNHALY